jgi:hypothetical protein
MKDNKIQEALDRYLIVLELLKTLNLSPSYEDLDILDKGVTAMWSYYGGIVVNSGWLSSIKVTQANLDHLSFSLLHELGHAIQNTTNFYPKAQELARMTFKTEEAYNEAHSVVEFPEATYMHLEHDADAFAIDMALKLGMPDVMRYPGYL